MEQVDQKLDNKIEVVITREFDAPRELVFKAWTDPELLSQWWGPHYFTNPVCELDLRPGGSILIHMQGPDGVVYPMGGFFKEIVEPELLVFTSTAFEDEEGNPLLEDLNTITFVEDNGKTILTIKAIVLKASPEVAEALAGMEEGWKQSLDKLAESLEEIQGVNMQNRTKLVAEPGKQEVTITRVFDASPELVFKTMTDPNLVPHWWGPRNVTTVVDQMDVRQGGIWRYVQHDEQGSEYAFHGVYHAVNPSERLVYTFEYEGMPGHVLLETVTFEPFEGKTLVRDHSVFQSLEDRNGMLYSGMETGAAESMDRFSELLEKVNLS